MEEFSWLVKFRSGLFGTSELNLLLPAFTFALKLTPGLAFVSARHVCLAVKLPYAFMLYARLPTALREPLDASVTI